MEGNRFYSIPFDARNDPAISKLRDAQGGIAAYGRWQALLGILFDEKGVIDANEKFNRRMLERELELKGEKLDTFIRYCVEFGLLSFEMWQVGMVGSHGVCKELEYRAKQSEKGAKGAEARRKKEEEAKLKKEEEARRKNEARDSTDEEAPV